MSRPHRSRSIPSTARQQRGVATLLVTLSILIILTIIVLASSNVALFEQRTATNENRQRLSEQAAEYAVSLGGEFFKANVTKVSSSQTNGWRDAATARWVTCNGFTVGSGVFNPCLAEPDATRRNELYVYQFGGSTEVPYESLVASAGQLSVMGDSATSSGFDANATKVYALLCLIDATPGTTPECDADPGENAGNNIAITLVARSSLANENATAEVKETWGTFTTFSVTSAMPLVAAGLVEGLGNATIVAAPNAGGTNVEGSIWSPQDVDVDATGTGIGAVTTCHMGDYLGDVDVSELKTTCATTNDCGCDAGGASDSFLSGHVGAVKVENTDILDIDGNNNINPDYEDIQFFPGQKADGTQLDDATVDTDDSLFEWIFNKDVVPEGDVEVPQNCTTSASFGSVTDCAVAALEEMGAEPIATCADLDSDSDGLYYVLGACSLPTQVGSPDNNAIVVVNNAATVTSNSLFYGMLFIRSYNNSATFSGAGTPQIFGALVVEGDVNVSGNLTIVYTDTGAKQPGDPLPESTRFGRLSGSWFDNRTSF